MNNTENFGTAINILTEKSPKYNIVWNVQYSEELAKKIGDSSFGKLTEYYLDFHGHHNANSFKEKFQRLIPDIILDFKKKKSLKEFNSDYFQVIIEELESTKSTFEFINIRDTNFYFQKDAEINLILAHDYKNNLPIDSIEEEYFKEIYKISNYKYKFLQFLIEGLEKLILEDSIQEISNNIRQTNEIKKLELKLPVPEIALLFRLLDDENLINYKHKTEIYKHIADTVKTNNQNNISGASVKNKFLSPDNTAIKNLDILLVNLRQQLKKIQQ